MEVMCLASSSISVYTIPFGLSQDDAMTRKFFMVLFGQWGVSATKSDLADHQIGSALTALARIYDHRGVEGQ